jgi:SAM-dependent methyltransferase
MLSVAENKSIYRNLYHDDITATSLPVSTYDMVISSFAICHIKELNQLFKEINRILISGGYFVLVDYHPFFLLNGIPTHFTNSDGNNIAIDNYIHLFSDYISEGGKQHFELLEMKEQIVSEKWAERVPSMVKHINMPVSFAMVWKKS